MINVIVGSGTLVTFRLLLLFGYPAITANVSNNIGPVASGEDRLLRLVATNFVNSLTRIGCDVRLTKTL